MNQEKIGKFIAKNRKDKGLTQEKNKRLRKLVDNKLKQSVSL